MELAASTASFLSGTGCYTKWVILSIYRSLSWTWDSNLTGFAPSSPSCCGRKNSSHHSIAGVFAVCTADSALGGLSETFCSPYALYSISFFASSPASYPPKPANGSFSRSCAICLRLIISPLFTYVPSCTKLKAWFFRFSLLPAAAGPCWSRAES